MGKLLYGGDYNPEQWLDCPEILEKDIELLLEAKINCVTLGVFSWSMLEPVENEFQFEWLENIINKLYKNGIKTILATPSGARPKWLSDKYPEVLRVRENRTKNLYGRRHNHCYTSPVYREKVAIMNKKLAEKFGDNDAIIMWHISNEFGGDCHCPLCQEAFRAWLKTQYSSIEEVNKKWCTTFWSHTYNSFEQIESPSSIGENILHGLNLDWKRFVTFKTNEFIDAEIFAIREYEKHKPTTANLMYNFGGLNYNELAKHVDVISWDAYPQWHKGDNALVALDTAMQHDLMRSLKDKPFLLMESSPSSTNWQSVSKLRKPNMLETASLQAVAHGSDSVQYFQLRQSRGSSEKFHGAVIDHYGENDTRVFKEVKKLGEGLDSISEVLGSNVKSDVAIIYDTENRWAMEDSQGPRNKGLFHKEAVLKAYSAFRKNGVNVDVIGMEKTLDKYKVVVAPMLYMFKYGIEDKIREFVAKGGTLVMTYWSGIVDENDRCFLGGTPHGLMDVLGIRSEEIDGLYDDENNVALPIVNYLGANRQYICKNLCDIVKVSTATELMVYGEDFYRGRAVLTENKHGEGLAYYISADMEQDFYDDFVESLLSKIKVEPLLPKVADKVFVSSRYNDKYTYIFVQNYGKDTEKIELPENAEVIYGSLNIEELSTTIIKVQN